MKKEMQEKIERLQLIEQGMQSFLAQKQQFQVQLAEIESALSEIEGKDSAYKIVGNIMVMAKREEIEKDLNEKKEMLELRLNAIEKQENATQDKAKKLQEEVLKGMEK